MVGVKDMKQVIKKGVIALICLCLAGGGIAFRGELFTLGVKTANFGATYYFTGGKVWTVLGNTNQNSQPTPPAQEEEPAPSQPAEASPTPLSPTPPAGVKTGKVQTKTLPLSAANTVGSGVHISNKTDLKVNLDAYLEQGMPFSLKNTGQPQVLIVHTHATECYLQGDYGYYISSASTRSTDNTQNTVRVGQVLAEVLNEAGIVAINDATQHDYPNYTGSYTRSRQTIENYLEKYPTIQVVIDLHRDAIGSDGVKIKPTVEIGGKKAAQIMILAGCETGSVENFPNWQENFKFCLQLQRQLETDYENLCRPLLFKACKYNFDISAGSILVEMGTDANTLQEAEYSATLLGRALTQILQPA